MIAFILAAGLGTRLRPWTLHHPKALVPVGGVPMLERVITRLREAGFTDIVVNVHHFASQITEFLSQHDFGVSIAVSDESGALLDTGGALLHARHLLPANPDEPFLVHNVDILSNASLGDLAEACRTSRDVATLLVSPRESSRRLVFSDEMLLRGWHNCVTEEWRPAGFHETDGTNQLAFSGIYAMKGRALDEMMQLGLKGKFPVMDYFLHPGRKQDVRGLRDNSLSLIDIGKPETLAIADR